MTFHAALSSIVAAVVLFNPVAFAEDASPAQRKITSAQNAIAMKPQDHRPYNDLALALTQRARETSDAVLYVKADEALQKGFSLSPENLEGQKIKCWILLGQHEFSKALEQATLLNKKIPDDVMIYGMLSDANTELGNYEEAEKATQWMLDLRPGNIPALTRAAHLRELFGDIDGAQELMQKAYQRTNPVEVEDRAWILTHLAHLSLVAGRINDASTIAEQALTLFPSYHYALGALAKVRIAQKRYAEAVELERRRYTMAPHPENLYALAEAQYKAGQLKQARQSFREFEKRSLSESNGPDNSNHELIYYYINYANDPRAALKTAKREISRRQDVYTLDAYAWALHANRQYAEANKQMERALSVGIRDPKMLYHAGMIALKLNQRDTAKLYLQQAHDLSRDAGLTTSAQKSLRKLGHTKQFLSKRS